MVPCGEDHPAVGIMIDQIGLTVLRNIGEGLDPLYFEWFISCVSRDCQQEKG